MCFLVDCGISSLHFLHLARVSLSFSLFVFRVFSPLHVHSEKWCKAKNIIISITQQSNDNKTHFSWKSNKATYHRHSSRRCRRRLSTHTKIHASHAYTGIKNEFLKAIGNILSIHMCGFLSALVIPTILRPSSHFPSQFFELFQSRCTQYRSWNLFGLVWFGLSWFVVVLITMFDILLPQNVCALY